MKIKIIYEGEKNIEEYLKEFAKIYEETFLNE